MEKNCNNCRFNIDSKEFDMKHCKKCSRTDRALYEPIVAIENYSNNTFIDVKGRGNDQ